MPTLSIILNSLGFLFVLGLLFYFGLRNISKIKQESTYILADRKTGFWALTATLVMTEFNTSTLIAFSGAGYHAGLRALLLPSVFLIGLIFYALTVSKKWQALKALSVSELFERRYSKNLAKFASLMLLLSMFGFCATYIKSMTLIFVPLFSKFNLLNFWSLSFILVLLILSITLRGGLVSIIRTDVVSFVLFLIFIPILLYFTYSNSFQNTNLDFPNSQDILPSKFIISLIILTCFTYILAPWYGQKIFSAKSSKIAFSAVLLASIIIFVLYGGALLATALLKAQNINLSSGEEALPYIFKHILPVGLSGAAYALIFAAAATTLSGVWSAMTTMIIGDYFNYSETQQKSSNLNRSIIITLILALTTWILANTFVDNILDKLILANIPVFALSYALLAGFYTKSANSAGAWASTIVGIIWGVFCYAYFGEAGSYTWYWAIYGLPIIFITGKSFSSIYLKRNSLN